MHSSKHAELMNLACKSAILNRGVSHLIFPDEVQNLKVGDAKPGGPQGRITPLEITPPRESLDKAVELLRGSKRPVIVVGHGARFHMDAITELAEMLNAPVITTFKGKGLISDQHPRTCGPLRLAADAVPETSARPSASASYLRSCRRHPSRLHRVSR